MWEPMRILPELTNRQGPELALGEPEYRSVLIPPEMQDTAWQLIGALRNKPQEARRAMPRGLPASRHCALTDQPGGSTPRCKNVKLRCRSQSRWS